MRILSALTLVVFATLVSACGNEPATYHVELEIRNHLFYPDELRMPADTIVRLTIHNRDKTPEEFESHALNKEKLIMGGQTTSLIVGPLPEGEYSFFGAFNPQTALGVITAEAPGHADQ